MPRIEKHLYGPINFYERAVLFGPFETTNNDAPTYEQALKSFDLVKVAEKEKKKGAIVPIKCKLVIFGECTAVRTSRAMHRSQMSIRDRHDTDQVFQIENEPNYVIYSLKDTNGPAYLIFKFKKIKIAKLAFKNLNYAPVMASKDKKESSIEAGSVEDDEENPQERAPSNDSGDSGRNSRSSLLDDLRHLEEDGTTSSDEEETIAEELSRSLSINPIVEMHQQAEVSPNITPEKDVVTFVCYGQNTLSTLDISKSSMQLVTSGTFVIVGGKRYTFNDLRSILQKEKDDYSESDDDDDDSEL